MPALIDANLLCLLVVGLGSPRSITDHPRLKIFDRDDFEVLGHILDRLGGLVLCPQVIAEASNLLACRQPPERSKLWRDVLARLIDDHDERNDDASRIAAEPAHRRLGFTDAALLLLCRSQTLSLLSDDLPLCHEAERRGLRVINYNYFRDGAMTLADL